MTPNNIEKAAIEETAAQKMETAFRLSQKNIQIKSLSYRAKCSTVVKSDCSTRQRSGDRKVITEQSFY